MLLSDAIDGYLLFKSTRCTDATIRIDRIQFDQLLDRLGDRDIADLTNTNIANYLAWHRGRGLSNHTIRRHLSIISSLYRWLCSDEIDLASANPTAGIPLPKLDKLLPKALTQETVAALIAAIDRSRNPRRDLALIHFLLDTCARATETCRVRRPDLDLASGRVKLLGKGQKERAAYLGRQSRSKTWLYISNERPAPARARDDRLFLTRDGNPLTRHTLRGIIQRLARRAGVSASPHQFRHTGAIEHLRNGMNLVSLQRLLGHSDIATTRRYLTALDDDDIQRAAQRSSPADNWQL